MGAMMLCRGPPGLVPGGVPAARATRTGQAAWADWGMGRLTGTCSADRRPASRITRLGVTGRPAALVRTLGRSTVMIGIFVTFRYGDNFDEQAVRKIAETARARFEGMPGLRSKAFTVNPGKREATNFYIWDSEDAAKAFFTDALLERVSGL